MTTEKELERARKRAFLTKKDMAAILGVSRQTYHNWLKGGRVQNDYYISELLKRMAYISTEQGWDELPPGMGGTQYHKARLLALLQK